jgi:hypothetical protein
MKYNYKEIDLKGYCTFCERWVWSFGYNNQMWCNCQQSIVPANGTCDKYKGV